MKHSGALKKLVKKILFFADNNMGYEMNYVNKLTHPQNYEKAAAIIKKRRYGKAK